MNDLTLFGGTGQVILENAATRFLLQGSTYNRAVESKILDYSGFVLDLLKSVRNNKPNYSEVFIDSPLGLGVARLVVDPFSYWINTSAPGEVAAFEALRSDEHTSELQSLMRTSYAVFCLKKKQSNTMHIATP